MRLGISRTSFCLWKLIRMLFPALTERILFFSIDVSPLYFYIYNTADKSPPTCSFLCGRSTPCPGSKAYRKKGANRLGICCHNIAFFKIAWELLTCQAFFAIVSKIVQSVFSDRVGQMGRRDVPFSQWDRGTVPFSQMPHQQNIRFKKPLCHMQRGFPFILLI